MSRAPLTLPVMLLLWSLLWLLGVSIRPPFPIDETRYLTVAWEMYQRNDWLLLHLNGAPYSHKPPLLFWLINLGWGVFGVNGWWPRLVVWLCALLGLLGTHRLARRLWPARPQIALTSTLLLGGCSYWLLFSHLLMFDLILSAWVVLGLNALLRTLHGERAGWLLLAIATALGGLTKGPVILLHLGLAALVMRLTLHEPASPRQWLPKALATIIVGLLPLLLWALLAAHRGGDAFAHELLFKQTGERMVSSFAHRRPFWWLLAMLPLLLLPWTLSLTAWRAAKGLPRLWSEPGLRFAALWSLAVLAAFSLISGKQPHYLLPIFPALALLLARAIDELPQSGAPQREWLLAGMLLLFALSIMLITTGRLANPQLQALAPLLPGWLAAAFALLALLCLPGLDRHRSTLRNSLVIGGMTALLYLGPLPAQLPRYRADDVSALLHEAEQQQIPVAFIDFEYDGQFTFPALLRQPLAVVPAAQAHGWAAQHPDGWLLFILDEARAADSQPRPLLERRYRGSMLYLYSAQALLEQGEFPSD